MGFHRALVDALGDGAQLGRGHASQPFPAGPVAHQGDGVFAGAALLGGVGVGEEDRCAGGLGDAGVLGELAAVVGGDGADDASAQECAGGVGVGAGADARQGEQGNLAGGAVRQDEGAGAPMGAGVREGVHFPMTALGAGVGLRRVLGKMDVVRNAVARLRPPFGAGQVGLAAPPPKPTRKRAAPQPRHASAPPALARPPPDTPPPRHCATPPATRWTRPRTTPPQSGEKTSPKTGVPQSVFVVPSSVICSSQPPFGGL